MHSEIIIDWHEENRIVLIRMIGNIGEILDEELRNADKHLVKEFLDASPDDTVHIIFDHSELKQIPPTRMHRVFQFVNHSKLGWCVSFGDNDVTRFYVSSFSQQNRISFQSCPSPEECLDFLTDMDSSLPSDLSPISTMGTVPQ